MRVIYEYVEGEFYLELILDTDDTQEFEASQSVFGMHRYQTDQDSHEVLNIHIRKEKE